MVNTIPRYDVDFDAWITTQTSKILNNRHVHSRYQEGRDLRCRSLALYSVTLVIGESCIVRCRALPLKVTMVKIEMTEQCRPCKLENNSIEEIYFRLDAT
jgi:hypothetical protein